MGKLLEHSARVLGITLLIASGFLLLRPQGAVHGIWAEWRSELQNRRTIRDEWQDLSSAGAGLGAEGAEPALVEFIDYTCTYCRVLGDTITQFLTAPNQYGKTAIAIRQLPHPASPNARRASLAAVCADAQGRFPQMHALLLRLQLTQDTDLQSTAGMAGVSDLTAFHMCLQGDSARMAIARDSVWASRLGLRATPAIVSERGGLHIGVATIAQLTEWLPRQ